MVELHLNMWEELLPYLISVGVAAACGGLVGVEREYRDKSAGFRTMILIAVGACLFTIMSEIIGGPDKDSARIAAAIVSGVGFLGAGVVIKDGVHIRGLTTAASIWLVASLGMAAGYEQHALAGAVAAVALVVLWVLPPLERVIDRMHEFLEIQVTIKNTDTSEDDILDIFDELKIKIVSIQRSRDDKSERTLHIQAKLNPAKHKELSEILVNEEEVLKFKV